MPSADVAIVGGGIVGLAFAFAHAKRGRSVVIFERNEFAIGASIRNFGLIWPIGQSSGPAHDRAMFSRSIWDEVIVQARLWSAPTGSLHLAYAEDELSVLEEFVKNDDRRNGRKILTADETLERSITVNKEGLQGALWSATEINIDSREAMRAIPRMLTEKHFVTFKSATTVRAINLPSIETSSGEWHAGEVVVCTGSDFEALYPEAFAGSGITRCKLQMMRTRQQPNGWALGPALCSGLTLLHYPGFKGCPSLESLEFRLRTEYPFHIRNGIHVLLSQASNGDLIVGDSHQYGHTLEPFDLESINEAILDYLYTFANAPVFEIGEYWNGIYAKVSGRTEFVANPADGVTVVTGLGGAGMTLSFGLAEEMVSGGYKTTSSVPQLVR